MHTNLNILDLEQGADGEGQIPSWNANGLLWWIEKGRGGMWAALGLVPAKLPILQPPAWPCPRCGWRRSLASIHCKKSAIGCGKSSVCSNTVTGAALCSASHAPALPKAREAGAYSDRQIRSKRQNTMGPSSPERLCVETPGQGWTDLLLKVLRKPSGSSRGVTRVGKAAATGNLQPPA